MMARSRRPFVVVMSGAFRRACACFSDSQFPVRTPIDFALFTRAMPAASSGANSPLSAASAANFRTAVIRTLKPGLVRTAGYCFHLLPYHSFLRNRLPQVWGTGAFYVLQSVQIRPNSSPSSPEPGCPKCAGRVFCVQQPR